MKIIFKVLLLSFFLPYAPCFAQVPIPNLDHILETEVSTEKRFDNTNLSIALKASTIGFGVELAKPISERINIRAGASYLDFTFDFGSTVIDLPVNNKVNLQFNTVELLSEWRIFKNNISVVGGAYYNLQSPNTSLSMTFLEGLQVGELIILPEDLGTLEGDINFSSLIPYAGINFLGNAVPSSGKIGIKLEIGVFYLGSPEVQLSGTGALSPTANEENSAILTEQFKSYQFYPNFSIRIAYGL